jgi:probable HAF family extracellular repeat protein
MRAFSTTPRPAMKSLLAVLFASCVVSALPAAAIAAPDYTVTLVNFPGAVATAIYAVNDAGRIVGAEREADGTHRAVTGDRNSLAFVDATGPLAAAQQSWAFSINRLGDIAGEYIDASGVHHGYVMHAGGAFEMIDYPQASSTAAYGVNGDGHVIGVYSDAAGAAHAFTLRNGRYRNADLPGAIQTVPLSIDDEDEIVGQYTKTPDTTGYGFLQRRGGHVELFSAPGAPAESTFYISINNQHRILGTWYDADGNPNNFVKFGDHLTPFVLPDAVGSVYTSAQTINDNGDIVGYYFDANFVAHGYYAAHR